MNVAWEKRDLDSYDFEANNTWALITIGFGFERKIGRGVLSVSPVYEDTFTPLFREDSGSNGSLRFLGIRLMYY